jgi:hypothetical protein
LILMVVLGLLLVGASVGLAVDVVSENTATFHVFALGHTYSVTPGWLFVIGCATALVGLTGLVLLMRGIAGARRRRANLNESRGAAEGLKAERDRLAAALDAERLSHDTARPARAVRVGAPTAEALAATHSGNGN